MRLRSLSPRLRGPVPLIDTSPHSAPSAGIRIQDGKVVSPLARHFEAGLLQRGHDTVAVARGPGLDALFQICVGELLQAAAPAPRGRERAGSRLEVAGPLRIAGLGPPVLGVQPIAQRVEQVPVPGRRDVEGLPGPQIDPGGEDVHVAAAVLLSVENRAPAVAVRLQPGPGRPFEFVEGLADLRVRRTVFGSPRDYAGGIPVLEAERVRRRRHQLRIAAKNLDARPRAAGGIDLL